MLPRVFTINAFPIDSRCGRRIPTGVSLVKADLYVVKYRLLQAFLDENWFMT